jgi:soluble lytic murein transglycosylase
MGDGALVRARGLYWAGRSYMRANARTRAIERFREAMTVEPLHYYALLARQRLEELGEDAGDPFPEAEAREALAPLPRSALPEEVSFYSRLGLRKDAVEALRANEREVRAAQPDDRGLEGLVAAYGRLGEVARPYRLVATAERAELARRPDGYNMWIWRAAYPDAFRRQVAPAARARGLEPEYLWAIMRQESGYEPEAVSYADAIGLLQMLPATTRRVAEGLGVPFSRELLFDPAWNARFAAQYNARLEDRYGVPLSFAAYNGGGHRVDAWLQDRAPTDLDLFVERIGITQTKNYIRRVTSHYARYLYLRDPEAGWPLELPLRVGE